MKEEAGRRGTERGGEEGATVRLVENVQNGTKMGGAGMGIAADAAGGNSGVSSLAR